MRTAAPRIFAVLLLGVGLVAPVRAHDPFSGAQPKQRAPAAETQPRKGRQAPAKKKASRPPPAADGAREDDERDGRPTDQDAPLTPPAPPDERETAAA